MSLCNFLMNEIKFLVLLHAIFCVKITRNCSQNKQTRSIRLPRQNNFKTSFSSVFSEKISQLVLLTESIQKHNRFIISLISVNFLHHMLAIESAVIR